MKKHQKHSGKNDHPLRNGDGGKQKRAGLHRTRIDLPEKARVQLCELLNQTLANTLDLYTQTKQAHWNVKGVQFYSLHLLFDEIAGEVDGYVDLVAERVTSLGGTAMGTVRMSAEGSTLPEYPSNIMDGMEHVAALADRLAMYGELVREGIDISDDLGDKDTADLYTEISRDIDKRLWFLEAHLQAETSERESKNSLTVAKTR